MCTPKTRAAIAVLLAGVVSACAPSETPTGQSMPEQTAAESGADLFALNCGPCHGPGGRGPSLETLKALSSEARRSAIRNHPTAGQIPQRLPANEIGDLIEFLDE